MSFNRASYDACSYTHTLNESTGIGRYLLETPRNDCNGCFPEDPAVRLQGLGGAKCKNSALIDVDSELIGIRRPYSRCPTGKHRPDDPPMCEQTMPPACSWAGSEDTRLSNPPCTLRSTGWNRWEWLARDPQAHAIVNFPTNINNRILVKDNHRPCIPGPMGDAAVRPRDAGPMQVKDWRTGPATPMLTWRSCCEVAQY
jgi:hypothetical protein